MRSDITYNKYIDIQSGQSDNSPYLIKNNHGLKWLADMENEDFVNYIEWLGLDKDDPNLIVLSSFHHYFYDFDEMKNVKTVVNLKYLNEIRDIKSFLHSIYTILAPKSNLVGRFTDSKNHKGYSFKKRAADKDAVENGILSKIPLINTLYNIMDSRTNRNLSRNNATFLLENNGFKVHDITELNGITYFHAKRI